METNIFYRSARTSVGSFFMYGAHTALPIPPLEPTRGMSAAVLMAMAVALWVMVEFLDIYFRRLDTTKRRRRQAQKRNLVGDIISHVMQDILSTLGMAPASRGATGRNRSGRRR